MKYNNKEMNTKLLKLARMIMNLAEVKTDKAVLIAESELAEGVEVYVEVDGDLNPAEDGVYETETQLITVEGGKVVKIEDKQAEEVAPEVEVEETNLEGEQEPVNEPDTNAEVEDLRNQLAEKDAQIAALQERIDALIAENEKLKQEPVAMSAENKNKKEQKVNTYFPSFMNKK